jgi:hypothetical protein
MSRSSFDFDVITGPAKPRPAPRPAPRPEPANGTPQQGTETGK